jgi:uncharacterized protein involved in exopolysaccharide biosynthesis/MinD-like ATPase involved in chromosome partitioning or flagellar assembly
MPQLLSNQQMPAPPDAEAGQHVPPSRVFGVLFRRKLLILGIVVGLSVPAILVVRAIPPFYDATALLMIDTRESSFRDLQATVATQDSDLVAIATQVGIIRSPSMAAKVVDRLDLVHEPEFAHQLDAPPGIVQRISGRIAALLHHPLPPKVDLTDAERRQLTGALLTGKLSVLNDSKSYMISIKATTLSPQLSAAIANAYVAVYLDFKQQRKIEAIHRANSLLDEQMAPLSARVNKADQAVETYREQHGLILIAPTGDGDVGSGTTVAGQQLGQINGQLIAASAELAQKQASLRQIQAAERTGRLDSIPEVVTSPLISSLRTQQSDLSSRAASLNESQAANAPGLRSALAAETQVQQRINLEIGKIAASVGNQVDSAQAQVDVLKSALSRLQEQVATQSEATVTLRQLESEARAARGVYQNFLGRFEQTLNQSALQEAEAELVSPADIPIGKSGPPVGTYAALAVVVNSAIACLLALLVDRLRQGIRTIDQLEAQTGLFGLGFVPTAPRNLQRLLRSGRPSIYNECVSLVGNLLQFGQERYRAKVVLVTSAVPNEGKTVFALSLAASVGREGKTALLIDCDMRRPSVAKFLKLTTTGQEGTSRAILRQGALPGVDIITFRRIDKRRRQMVTESEIQKLLDEARHRYNMIILDAPPVLPFADTPILSIKADGAVMVVRWRHTSAGVIANAVKMLGTYGVRVLGGVVTQVNMKDVAESDGGSIHMYRRYATFFR